jgi:hypothetical protein
LNVALGFALGTTFAAYLTFMVALGIFIVNAFSLVVWRARYESKSPVVILLPLTLLIVLTYRR